MTLYLTIAHNLISTGLHHRALSYLSMALSEANKLRNKKAAGNILVAMASCRRMLA